MKKQTNLRFKRLANHPDCCDSKLEITLVDGLSQHWEIPSGVLWSTRSGQNVLHTVAQWRRNRMFGGGHNTTEPEKQFGARNEAHLPSWNSKYRVSRETLQCFGTTTHIARSCRHKGHFAYFSFIVLCFGWLTCECKRCCGSTSREESHSKVAVCAASGT